MCLQGLVIYLFYLFFFYLKRLLLFAVLTQLSYSRLRNLVRAEVTSHNKDDKRYEGIDKSEMIKDLGTLEQQEEWLA